METSKKRKSSSIKLETAKPLISSEEDDLGRVHKEHNIEPSELHYDLEMSLQDYYRKHPEMGKAEAYDAWFKENRKFIEDVVREVAKEDNVEIIKGRKTAKPKRSKEKEPEGAWFHYYTVTERDIPIIGIGSVSHQSNMLRGEQKS
jgi:hypothetical protein